MDYFPHFMCAEGSYILWQKGHYHYEITKRAQPFEHVKTIMNSCSEAVKIFKNFKGQIMNRIKEIFDEIEDMLYGGYTVDEVANKLIVPLDWAQEVETFLFQKANEESFVTQGVTDGENLSIIEEFSDDLY